MSFLVSAKKFWLYLFGLILRMSLELSYRYFRSVRGAELGGNRLYSQRHLTEEKREQLHLAASVVDVDTHKVSFNKRS